MTKVTNSSQVVTKLLQIILLLLEWRHRHVKNQWQTNFDLFRRTHSHDSSIWLIFWRNSYSGFFAPVRDFDNSALFQFCVDTTGLDFKMKGPFLKLQLYRTVCTDYVAPNSPIINRFWSMDPCWRSCIENLIAGS